MAVLGAPQDALAANPSANLDQCANDPAPSPNTNGCATNANQWVNGNLGASKSLYMEGDSIPYRLTMANLTLSSHQVTIEWDTTKSSTHAIDYLTTVTQSVTDANPCLGISPCNPNVHSDFSIPVDPQLAPVTPIAGKFRMYGGTITGVSAYSYANGTGFTGDKSARITLTFTPTQANPVLAWGGHIATRKDWGMLNSAVSIPGSPYHTRLIDLDGSGGNQDRSLSADAVIFPGSLTVVKQATPEGPTSFPFTATPSPLTNFNLVDDGTAANTKLFDLITDFKAYTINETPLPAGWGFDSANCAVVGANGGSKSISGSAATVTIAEGENWTCTYTNSLRTGMLIVKKHVVNNNGGSATSANWSLHVKSGSTDVTGSPQPGSEAGTSYTLNAGSYTVSETGGPSGYLLTGISGDCASNGTVTVVAGQTKTCTLTNDDQTAHLKLVKQVTNDNGGTKHAADFTLTAGPGGLSGNPNSGTNDTGSIEQDVNAGSYTLSESGPAGYTAGTWSCGPGASLSGSTITLALGESRTCTITNNDDAPVLHLRKVIGDQHGGTAVATDFTLTATGGIGGNNVSGITPVNSGATLKADTWTLSESGPSGYSGSWACTGGGSFDGTDHITLANGQEATCTITNNGAPAHLKLTKTVINDNGGTLEADDFPLSAAGPTPLSGAPTSNGNPLVGSIESDVDAGTYVLTETGDAGYTASAWTCTGGTLGTNAQQQQTVTLALGASASCSITNNDKTAHLTLVKTVVNDDGGTLQASAFPLTADGPTSLSGAPVSNGDPLTGSISGNVNAGAYALSETTQAGYAAGDWDCGTVPVNNGSITLALGQSATCTIVNDDQAAHLMLVKNVVNDSGGTLVAADFPLSATGPSTLSGDPVSDNDPLTGSIDSAVDAGTYVLAEAGDAGYTASAWSCTGGTLGTNAQNQQTVTLALNASATCTISNDDKPAHLKLVKHVVNDNGGTKHSADVTLTASGPSSTLTGAASGGSEPDLGYVEGNVNAGTYTLSETELTGYAASAWDCGAGAKDDDVITLALGQSLTCTITNDDQPAALKLVKKVINDNGGVKHSADFTLYAAGPTGFHGPAAGGVDPDAGYVSSAVDAGKYDLSEDAVAGYAASAWSCDLNTQVGASITLALGSSATCTITNDDVAPKLHLIKHVTNDNGGTAVAGDFTLTADGAGANDVSGQGTADSGATLKADTWTLSESGPGGYAASGWTCVGGSQVGNQISVGIGGEATCSITNDDIAPKLHLRKVVTNDNGGTATVADFPLSADGLKDGNDLNGVSPVDSTGTLKADTWTLSETNVSGYTPSNWVCTSGINVGNKITLTVGQEATCTITNDDQTAHLKLVKQVVNDNGGTATPQNFTLTATGPSPISGAGGVEANVNTGTYTLSETNLPGYAAGSWNCGAVPIADGNRITLALGQSATCTIVNDDVAPKLHLHKTVINDNGGTKTVSDFPLTATGLKAGNNLSGISPVDSTSSLKSDTWTLTELNQYGYTASAWSCTGGTQNGSSITVGIGGEATCTITNNDIAPKLIVKKVAKPATGSFAFTTTGTGYAGYTLPAGGSNTQTLNAGSYTAKESSQLGWILTGIGGSTDPNAPYNCIVSGSGGSTGTGNLDTQTVSVTLKVGDTVTCTFENTGLGVTRTQGFWATHPKLANIAWFGGTEFGHTFPGVAAMSGIGDNLLCGRPIDTLGKLMGAFWSDVSKTSTGAKRSALDQARMQLLQQLLAAELNASAFGSTPASGSFAAWEGAYCGTNTTAIKNAQQQAASFNSAGDSATFTPGTAADSKSARAGANYAWWDLLP